MRVREAMTRAPATCEPTTSLRLVAQLMTDHDCAAIPITRSGELVGIVTDRDIACRAVRAGWNAPEIPAGSVMSAPAIAIGPDEQLEAAIDLMKENRIHHLLVIDPEGRLLGIIAQSDLGQHMVNRDFGDLARAISTPPPAWHGASALTRRDH
jgi:CBS domain-containing protein